MVRLDYSTWSGNTHMLAVGRGLGFSDLGFSEEARFRDAREVRGARFDSVVMGVLRSEWEARADARACPRAAAYARARRECGPSSRCRKLLALSIFRQRVPLSAARACVGSARGYRAPLPCYQLTGSALPSS